MKHTIWLLVVPVLIAALDVSCRSSAAPSDTSTSAAQDPVKPQPAPAKRGAEQPDKPGGKSTGEFEDDAFPPTMPDIAEHGSAWLKDDCLRCHETGVGKAPEIVHKDLPEILLAAKCRTCHVFIPGSKPRERAKKSDEPGEFEENAFPPMIPASGSHKQAWTRDDCLMCHEDGTKGAPKLVHDGLPRRLQTAKCRTCHVQVRSVEASRKTP